MYKSECFEKLELLYYFYSRKPKEKTAGKLYQRSFEKRLYLVEFIMERQLPGVFLLKQSSNLRKRINWKQVCAEWNEMHPYDRMDPALLKVKYYRAIAEKDIQRKFYNRKFHESLVRLEQMIPKLWEYYDKEFKEEWEPLMKSQKATLAATLEAAKNLDKKYKEAQNERSHSQEVQE